MGCYIVKPVLAFFVLMIVWYTTNAQQFGGNPASLKWQQINTDTVRIIFPAGVAPTAERVASVVHKLQEKYTSGVGTKLRKINIVLQNQTSFANGYVGLGPWRSEFYLYAPQNSFDQGSLFWADKLAVHEYRHIQQYSNYKVGLSKLAGIILGQEGQAVANSAAIPDYFFEGDAVFNETSLTTQGRGRQPLFLNGYESLYRQDIDYSFAKLRNGSLKNYVPDHYQLGYLLVGYGRQKYGEDFWGKVTQDAARFKPLIYPWQGAIKKYTGKKYSQFVDSALDYYHQQWKKQSKTSINFTTKQTSFPTDYKYPTAIPNGQVVALKTSYREIPAFYLIDKEGNEKKIAVRDIAYDDYFSANGRQLVYGTLKPDARWAYREFSDLRILDIATGATKTISHRKRYFSPDIAQDGSKVVAVEMTTDQRSNIVLLDTLGNLLKTIYGEQGGVFTFPTFYNQGRSVVTASRNPKGEMALQKIDWEQDTVKSLIPFSNIIIGYPTIKGDTILFTSTFGNRDEAWAYVESTAEVLRMASVNGGLYHPTFNNATGQMVASVFTANGYRLATFSTDQLLFQKVNLAGKAIQNVYLPDVLGSADSTVLTSLPNRDFTISKYSQGFQLLNFHSWRPLYEQPEYSFSVYSQNILNTLQTTLQYIYNENEQTSKIAASAIFGGLYVQPLVTAASTFNRPIRYNRDTTFFYNENTIGAGLTLPLNLSGGKHYRFLTLTSTYNIDQLKLNSIGKRFFKDANFNYLQNRISFSSQVQKAIQQIFPRWAQVVTVQYRNVVNNYTANQFLASGSFYFPGIMQNHSLVLTAAYSARDTMNQYQFSDNFPFSRGYRSVNFPRMYKVGANYHFPLCYPDVGFGSIIYLLRLRSNLYADHTRTKSLRTGNTLNFNTAGVEVFADTKWWNQLNVTMGVRYSRLLNNEFRGVTNKNQWEIILPVNLF